MSEHPESAPAIVPPAADPARDGTYLEGGDGNFNNPANWSGGFVPTGTATISLNNSMNPISFTAATTPVEHIRVSLWAPLVVPRDCTVVVGKAGLFVTNKGTAQIDGKLWSVSLPSPRPPRAATPSSMAAASSWATSKTTGRPWRRPRPTPSNTPRPAR